MCQVPLAKQNREKLLAYAKTLNIANAGKKSKDQLCWDIFKEGGAGMQELGSIQGEGQMLAYIYARFMASVFQGGLLYAEKMKTPLFSQDQLVPYMLVEGYIPLAGGGRRYVPVRFVWSKTLATLVHQELYVVPLPPNLCDKIPQPCEPDISRERFLALIAQKTGYDVANLPDLAKEWLGTHRSVKDGFRYVKSYEEVEDEEYEQMQFIGKVAERLSPTLRVLFASGLQVLEIKLCAVKRESGLSFGQFTKILQPPVDQIMLCHDLTNAIVSEVLFEELGQKPSGPNLSVALRQKFIDTLPTDLQGLVFLHYPYLPSIRDFSTMNNLLLYIDRLQRKQNPQQLSMTQRYARSVLEKLREMSLHTLLAEQDIPTYGVMRNYDRDKIVSQLGKLEEVESYTVLLNEVWAYLLALRAEHPDLFSQQLQNVYDQLVSAGQS